METVGGIRPLEPGWSRFAIAPVPGPGLDWSKASFHSPRGKISVSWELGAAGLEVEATVPANTTARVVLPTDHGRMECVGAGRKWAKRAADNTFEVPAGHYRFSTGRP
jgi:alpha-L-rhamnosidase